MKAKIKKMLKMAALDFKGQNASQTRDRDK
jgi:hypothetical protein